MAETTTVAPTAGVRFTVASRPYRRFTNTQTVSNLSAVSFQPIMLLATGFVRRISLFFQASATAASAGALVAGDGPWNLIANVGLNDATGQPIIQPVTGYNLYLINKYLSSGMEQGRGGFETGDPQEGPEFAYSGSSTAFAATFRLNLDLEQDAATGYGCIPNLDSNASLQLKVDAAAVTVAYTGTTLTPSTLSVTVDQNYWAPVGPVSGGVAQQTTPDGYGDYLETRYETQTANASSENTLQINNRGGMIRGIIAISRAAGVRTAFTAGSNLGLILDNNAIDEGIKIETQQNYLRRAYNYQGADLTTSYVPLSAVNPGLDRGVIVWPFFLGVANGRDTWLATRVGSQLQVKLTPGASATQIEFITQLMQVHARDTFFDRSQS